MELRTVTWGGWTVRIHEPAAAEDVQGNVVLCHGFGAPGTDLIPLGPAILQFAPVLQGRVRFLFPEAPLDLADFDLPGGRAWWPIDMWKLQEAVASGDYRDLVNEVPLRLSTVRESYFQFLADCVRETEIPLSRTVLGGFSQGAMLSTDAALHLPEPVGGLVILSGSLINQAAWRMQLQRQAGFPVFQSHGGYDPILPLELAKLLRDAWAEANHPVRFCEFPGAHEIPYEVLQELGEFLSECLIRA